MVMGFLSYFFVKGYADAGPLPVRTALTRRVLWGKKTYFEI